MAEPSRSEVPAITLECASALTADMESDAQGERAKVVMKSAPRMPAVGFFGGHYGDRWYVDIIALTHNAVRRQLFDVFTMANALGKLLLDVGDNDLARVYAWLATLEAFVRVVFDVEDLFVYPLLDSHVRNARTSDGTPVYLPELLSVRGRKEAKGHVLDLLSGARKTQDVATGEIPAKISALRYALDQFGANMLDYFAAMEKFAPKLLKKALKHGEKEKMKMERKLFDYVLKQPQGEIFAALLTQCIERRNRRKEFVDRNIRREKHRVQFRVHVKNVEASHMQLARVFDQCASQYERRFNVQTFMQHCDANNDGKQTLEMFGDMDINYEANAENEPAAELEPAERPAATNEQSGGTADDHDIVDDDIIEVTADDEDVIDVVQQIVDDDDVIEVSHPVQKNDPE